MHVECPLFWYIALINEELQRVARLWNLHRIRPSTKNNSSPHGRLCLLYYHPEIKGAVDCKHDVDIDKLNVARDMCCGDLPTGSSPEFIELAELIVIEEGLECQKCQECQKMPMRREIFI